MDEIYFETYGCTANYNSTEIMKGLVAQAGFNIVNNPEIADLIVLNSCIVKEPTEEKIKHRLSFFLRKNKKVILAGCMPRLNQKKLVRENLFLLDTTRVRDIINLIRDIYSNKYEPEKYLKQRNEIKLCLPKIPKEKIIGINQISEGCLGKCSYCITRLAKGRLFSYPKEKIIKSVKSDLNSGCKEIWITSQDCSAYGNDLGKFLLPELLREIVKIEKKFYVRIGMMNPDNVLEILYELIEIYKNEKIFKFLHIPIQSGSNRILKKMNRSYSKNDILKIVSEFRKAFPEMHISTDIIAGYPGESEKDFMQSFEIIKNIEPETLNISKFWPRPFTPASKLEQLPNSIVKERVIRLAELHKEICIKNNKRYLGKKIKVLVDQKGLSNFKNSYLARDKNYRLFAIASEKDILGKYLEVIVKKPTAHYLIGEIAK